MQYKTGSISCFNGSNKIFGTGTEFTTLSTPLSFRVDLYGDPIYQVASITSDTEIVLSSNMVVAGSGSMVAATYVSALVFTLVGDVTADWTAGKTVVVDCGVDGYKFGTIETSVYTTLTTITLTSTSDSITSNCAQAQYSALKNIDYQLCQDFTQYLDYPLPTQGQAGSAEWLSRALTMIDDDLNGVNFTAGTGINIASGVISSDDDHVATRDYVDTLRNNNVIINGSMNLWQRGISFVAIAGGDYCCDRWAYANAGAAVHTVTRDTAVKPTFAESGVNSSCSLKMDCTTADTSIAATDYCFLSHRVEGFNFAPLRDKSCTLSFWARATKTGIYCVSFRNRGIDRSYVAEYTITASNTWQKVTIPITFDYSGGTWDYETNTGIDISFTLMAGSNFQTTADAWQTGNYLATSNQVNGVDSTSNDFYITQVQLERGGVTPFIVPPINEEWKACQRYYEASTYHYNFWNNPLHYSYVDSQFKATKRTTPTVTTTAVNMVNCTGVATLISISDVCFRPTGVSTSGFTRVWGDWTADSEL